MVKWRLVGCKTCWHGKGSMCLRPEDGARDFTGYLTLKKAVGLCSNYVFSDVSTYVNTELRGLSPDPDDGWIPWQ